MCREEPLEEVSLSEHEGEYFSRHDESVSGCEGLWQGVQLGESWDMCAYPTIPSFVLKALGHL